jgi:hypothetical protein
MELELRPCHQQTPDQALNKGHHDHGPESRSGTTTPRTIVLKDNHSQSRTRSTTHAFNGGRPHRQTQPVIRSPVIK